MEKRGCVYIHRVVRLEKNKVENAGRSHPEALWKRLLRGSLDHVEARIQIDGSDSVVWVDKGRQRRGLHASVNNTGAQRPWPVCSEY